MKNIITEEMRFRQRLCEYALKHGATRAARKYQTNRQFVYRQLKRYDGDVRSPALRCRRPNKSPKAHTEAEISLIRRIICCEGMGDTVWQRSMCGVRPRDTEEAFEACAARYRSEDTVRFR